MTEQTKQQAEQQKDRILPNSRFIREAKTLHIELEPEIGYTSLTSFTTVTHLQIHNLSNNDLKFLSGILMSELQRRQESELK